MHPASVVTCTAFAGAQRLAAGPLRDVARAVKVHVDRHADASVLVFDDATCNVVELDLRGTVEDVLGRLPADIIPEPAEAPAVPRGRGRPKLGVTAREVTLLPRHWEWLASQPGGASVTLRKLVEGARRAAEARDRQRTAIDVAYRFLSTMAGNAAGYEDALRALFALDAERFSACSETWPADVRDHARGLARRAFDAAAASIPEEGQDPA
ncbi:hypothetical protein LMG7141_02192 [Ralstonia condita]|jgi:hypothetical protein|uniref:DUF2239 domain-containing protein n=1 Tax=Ralstonia condita TaxID=3058600 RepID=A0ABM9JC66_9RALS|nr:DUF2239 family protein [Ralstonia sp. LMG 7141]MDE2201465.1 DUF2239 family protein [Burkholderiaceae bacterium]CAJ0789192.1 hypothetical protein LMG7141_02192 [Ralstonia sp. LMG 7141]